jgi:hypothetical protein
MGNDFDNIDNSVYPDNIELEYNVGFSLGGDIVCLSADAEYGIKVKMGWKIQKVKK